MGPTMDQTAKLLIQFAIELDEGIVRDSQRNVILVLSPIAA